MNKYRWNTKRSYDEIVQVLANNTYTGISKLMLLEFYKGYEGKLGLYSHINKERFEIILFDGRRTFINCPMRFFKGKIITKNGMTHIDGKLAFSSFYSAITAFIIYDLLSGDYLNFSKHIIVFVFVMLGWIVLGWIGCIAYRKTEKRLIEEVNRLFSDM